MTDDEKKDESRGPSREWLSKMADGEDAAGCVSVRSPDQSPPPACAACNVPWSDHLGVQGTCARLKKAELLLHWFIGWANANLVSDHHRSDESWWKQLDEKVKEAVELCGGPSANAAPSPAVAAIALCSVVKFGDRVLPKPLLPMGENKPRPLKPSTGGERLAAHYDSIMAREEAGEVIDYDHESQVSAKIVSEEMLRSARDDAPKPEVPHAGT